MADTFSVRTPRLMRAAASGMSGGTPRLGHGVLLVGVPALDPWVRARTAHYDAAWLSDDPTFPHAHVTILAPFPPDAFDRAAAIAASVAPFDFTLTRTEVFADGTIHLVPEPDEGFRALTDAARHLVGEVAPYWGRFEPVPHLTLDRVGPGVTRETTASAVAPVVPASGRAFELVLTWWEANGCRVLARFPLGGP